MNAFWMILAEGVLVILVGSMLYFVYDWGRHNKYLGVIGAVNESTWEHTKIALFPMVIAMMVDGLFWGGEPNYFIGKFLSFLVVILLIPALFYGYKALIRHDVLVLDIGVFMVAILAGQAVFYLMTQMADLGAVLNFLALDGILVVLAVLMIMTFLPVRNFIFKDPITKRYGFRGHKKNK